MRKPGFLARRFFTDPLVLSQLVVGLSYHSVAAPVAGSQISIPASRRRPSREVTQYIKNLRCVSGNCNLLQGAPRIEVGTPDQQRWPPLFPLARLFKALQLLALPVELECSSKQGTLSLVLARPFPSAPRITVQTPTCQTLQLLLGPCCLIVQLNKRVQVWRPFCVLQSP